MIHWDKQTENGKCNRYEKEKEWSKENGKTRTAWQRRKGIIKKSIFQGAFSYVLNDRFIKIAKFFYKFVCMYMFCVCVCVCLCFMLYGCVTFFLYNHIKFRDGARKSIVYIVYYFTKCSYSALDSKLRGKHGVKC